MMLIAMALAAAIQTAAATEVYKCPDAAGRIEYRDWPCAGASGEKIEAKDNSYASGTDLATIRAQDAAFNARQAAKQRAIDQANADMYRANERFLEQERTYQDSLAMDQALQYGYGSYTSGYLPYYYQERPKKLKVPANGPPPSVPAKRPPPSVPVKERPPLTPADRP